MTLFTAMLLTVSGMVPFLATVAEAQTQSLRPLRVNVFTVDAAMVAAKARDLFIAEGLDVMITTTPSSTDQMRGLSKGAFDLVSTAFDNVLAWSGREAPKLLLWPSRETT